MKRNPRKLKWTKAFRRAAGKEMTVDSTLTFAARRNIPVRYDRELVSTTIKAMDRVAEIRARREKVFHKKRMAGNRERQKLADAKLVAEQGHLLPQVRGSERRKVEGETMEVDVDAEGVLLGESMEEEVLELSEEVEDVEEEVVPAEKVRRKEKTKRKLLVSGGVARDGMEVD